jgi:hypothetical protein
VDLALEFHDSTTVLHGRCFGQPPRLRLAEFLDHAIDMCRALVALVTNDTHSRTLTRGERVGCPDLNSRTKTRDVRCRDGFRVGVQARCTWLSAHKSLSL